MKLGSSPVDLEVMPYFGTESEARIETNLIKYNVKVWGSVGTISEITKDAVAERVRGVIREACTEVTERDPDSNLRTPYTCKINIYLPENGINRDEYYRAIAEMVYQCAYEGY